MRNKTLRMTRAMRTALLVLLLSAVGMGKMYAQNFTVGDLNYSVNDDGVSVTVTGYGYASGDLAIPSNISYEGNTYSVTSIGDYAFDCCYGLTNITIPNSVTSIGDYAFSGCNGLTNITIGNSVTSIGEYAFADCSGLTNITIPNSVTSIGFATFYGCSGLTNLTIGNSVTSIGFAAFYGCSGLTNITIPNSVTSIGVIAFAACYGLGQIVVETGNATYDSRENCNAIIETGTNTLRVGCKNTTIPNSVTSIGATAFEGCSGLTNITIPNSVTSIGEFAFAYCSGLTNITIPNSVTSIGEYAFAGCEGLTNITIPNSVTSIGECAFYDCYGLTNITIPNSVTSIGFATFYGCSSLTNITIPNSVTTIGDGAFEGCYGLTNITIGNSVTSIGDYAFYDCWNLGEVITLGPEPPTLEGRVFEDCEKLIVCCGSKDAYMASEWANYFGTIEEDCTLHNVTVDEGNMTGGSVSASVSSTELGEEVQLSITPDEGMMLASLTISNANDPEQTVPFYPIGRSTSAYGFIMPPFDVVVTAAFTPNTSVGENSNAEASAYPNPTNGQMYIKAEGLKYISICNMLGQTVYEGNACGNAFEYDLGRHGVGLYLVRIETANGMAVKKVTVVE